MLNCHLLNARCSCLVQELARLLRSSELCRKIYTQLGVQRWACWISTASFLLGFNETLLGRTLNGWSNNGNKHILQIGLTWYCAVVSGQFLRVASKPWHSSNCWSAISFPHVEGWIFEPWELQPLVAWLCKQSIFRSLCTVAKFHSLYETIDQDGNLRSTSRRRKENKHSKVALLNSKWRT